MVGTAEDDVVILQPGHLLGRYELLAEIARGGMASVWVARIRGAHGFEKLVAIKTVLPAHASDAEFHTMLIDESRIASSIDHPNVAQIIDVGSDGGVLHVVMEWIDGDALQKIVNLLKKRNLRLPAHLAVRLVADACAGLHAAHELKAPDGSSLDVVHRDVSPQNLLLTSRGVVKVIDFGVAKAQGRLAGNTTTGFIRGKARYMPPEQALGKKVDRRTDVWALGAVLRVLLVGGTPYEAATEVEVLTMIARGDPPAPLPRDIPVPAPVARVLDRALAADPARRFPTAASMRAALEDALVQLETKASPEDVARWIERELPELTNSRRKLISAAREATNRRENGMRPSAPDSNAADDDAATIRNVATPQSGHVVTSTAPIVDAPRREPPEEDSHETLHAAVAREHVPTSRAGGIGKTGGILLGAAGIVAVIALAGVAIKMRPSAPKRDPATDPVGAASIAEPVPAVETAATSVLPLSTASSEPSVPSKASPGSSTKPRTKSAPARKPAGSGSKDPSKEDFGF